MKNLSKTIVALGIASFATIAQAKSDINIWNWSDLEQGAESGINYPVILPI